MNFTSPIIGKQQSWQRILTNIFNYCFCIALGLVLILSVVFISHNPNLHHANVAIMIIIIAMLIIIAALVLYGVFKFLQRQSSSTLKIITIINSILITILAFSIAYYVQMNNQLVDGRSCLHIARQLSTNI